MDNKNEKDVFNYTYSAMQQSEIESIRNKYMPAAEDKLTHLRRLDRSVTHKSTLISLIVGIIGVLILGTGMSCCMVWAGAWFIPGILIGIIGMIITVLAYPIYIRITKKEREKIAPEILRLTDELIK